MRDIHSRKDANGKIQKKQRYNAIDSASHATCVTFNENS